MPSVARMARVKRALMPKQGVRYVFQAYDNPWQADGKRVVIGPDGIVPELPEGARSLSIIYVQNWRGDKKPKQWSWTVKASVDADLVDDGTLPGPSQQVNEDGSVIVPEPEPEVRAPTSWIVVKPTASELAAYAGAMDWYSAGERREHSEQTARDMVRPVLSDKLPEGVIAGPFDDKAAALSSAYERLAGLHAGFVDDRE